MEHPRRSFPVIPALLLVLSWAVGPASAHEPASETDSETAAVSSETTESATATVPLGFGGLRVVVDPQTGQIVADPPDGTRWDLTISPDLLRRMSTSHEGLVEMPAPQGGIMVNLQGRFLSPLVAVVQPDGSVAMDHATLAVEPDETTESPETEEVRHDAP